MLGPCKLMNHVELTDKEYQNYCELIYRVAGIRIAENKRVMVGNRVRRRLRATGISSFNEYYTLLISPAGSSEMPLFLDAITTNETYFFRDIQNYDWLGDAFLPEIIQQAATRKRSKTLRLWSAACSTGEEPYSIALKVLAKRPLLSGWRVTVLGTDLSGAVLDAARNGSYDARAVHWSTLLSGRHSLTKIRQHGAGPSDQTLKRLLLGNSIIYWSHSTKTRSIVFSLRTS